MSPSLPARLLAPAAVLLAPLALFGPAALAGGVLAPGDGLGYYMPLRAAAAAAWRMGEPPFWNPWHFGGMPLLASVQAGTFYPGNLPFAFLPPGPAMNLAIGLAYAVAALAAYAYARAIQLPLAAAALVATAFVGSGYMVAHVEHLTMLQAAGLLPALFWAVERAAATGAMRFVFAFAALLAFQILAGYPQTTAMAGLMLAPYALWRVGGRAFEGRGPGPGLRGLLALGAAAALAVGVAMIQLLPTAELMAGSPRGHLRFAELVDHSWPARELLTMVFPYLFGTVGSELFRVPHWGVGPWRNEIMGYAGLGTLVLGVWGLMAARRLGQARYWALAALMTGLLALGGQTPLYRLWAATPGLKIMRVPGRHLLELDFALAVLAGLGLTWFVAQAPAIRRRAAAIALGVVAAPMAATVLGLLCFRAPLAARWQPWVPKRIDVFAALAPTQPAVWVPVLMLALTAIAVRLLAKEAVPRRQALLAAVIVADLGLFGAHQGWRALIPTPGPDLRLELPVLADQPRTLGLSATGYPFADLTHTRALRYPQAGMLFGARLVNGYEPIISGRYSRLVGHMAMGGSVSDARILSLGHHALDVLGCRWLRLDPQIHAKPAWSDPIEAHPRWERLPDEDRVVVYLNHRAMPRAWRPEAVVPATEKAAADHLAGDITLDARHTAYVEDTRLKATPGEAWARTLSPNRIRVRTKGAGPGLVVVSESWDAGWRATEAGQALPVRRVDGLVLGVEVGPGDHTIELAYEPPSWARAKAISGASAAALGAWALVALLLGRRRRRRPS